MIVTKERILESLEECEFLANVAISWTKTGEVREHMTDINIRRMELIRDIKEGKVDDLERKLKNG